ncbi:MAG: hypothetical protein FWH14_08610 [Oscillospiraceae bacterium]|nr:hypothetical protein [Oscillospiraceae bacterium]
MFLKKMPGVALVALLTIFTVYSTLLRMQTAQAYGDLNATISAGGVHTPA